LSNSSDSLVDAVAVRDVDGLPVPSMDGSWTNSSVPVVDERPLFSTQLVDSEGPANSSSSSSIDFNALPTDTITSNDTTTIEYTSSSSISNNSQAANVTLSVDPLPPDKRVASVRFTFVQSRVKALLEQYHSLVVIVNVGVYYNSREQFRTDLPQLLDWMHSLHAEHNCTVFFRETAAQHWSHTSSGYFEMDIDAQNSSMSSCLPIADSTPGNLSYAATELPV